MMVSHAQNGEDVVLRRVFVDQNVGFYLDIGACHPAEDSVTLDLYERGWHGVNVEPDHKFHSLLMQARPRDVNLLAAVGQKRGRAEFHPTSTRGHGTFDKTLALERTTDCFTERVPMFLLSDIIDCYGPDAGEIDFVKIDVEGWEADVIVSGDWVRHRPRLLVIEAVDDKGHPTHQSWEPILLKADYCFALFDGLNRFYCRQEDAELLLPRLAAPANVLDGWMRANDVQAHINVDSLQAELATVERRALEGDDRAEALGADLEEARNLERAANSRVEALVQETTRLRSELADVRQEISPNDAFKVDAARARAEAAAALRREEAAEGRMASLEMELVRRDEAAEARMAALEIELARRDALSRTDEAWIAAVKTSTSWRITAPLRAVATLLRGLRGRR